MHKAIRGFPKFDHSGIDAWLYIRIIKVSIFQAMGSSTVVRHERQKVSSTDSPRVEGSSPVRGSFFAEFISSNTILASMPE